MIAQVTGSEKGTFVDQIAKTFNAIAKNADFSNAAKPDEPKNWNDIFKDLVRDKFLIQEGRSISHLRNTLCHMSDISEEEHKQINQVISGIVSLASGNS